MNLQEAHLALLQASVSPIGLLLQCQDVEKTRQRLYKAKREAMDPELDSLQLRVVDHPEGNLVIVRGKTKEQKA